MNSLIFFNKTVRGHLHKVRDIPCEDYSGTYGDDNGRFFIAVIADGHGDKACFRSSFGSKAAVDIAIDQLKGFAKAALQEDPDKTSFPFLEQLKYPKGIQMHLRGLTDSIISKWYEAVYADLEKNPPTEEDYNAIGEKAESYRAGKHMEHIYGTTLIASLWMENYLILIQQGDGRCDVFYKDGHIDQPIPWDSRCHENVTTSMCDPDVQMRIRHCVIDLEKEPVAACFLGSDGVEDSFPDPDENQAGTHYFYKQLSIETSGMDKAAIEKYLDGLLPEFSERGSGDDVSVAGLVDPVVIQSLLPDYKNTVHAYEIKTQIAAIEAKIISKQRKHNVLRRRYNEAQDEEEKCINAEKICQGNIRRLSQELNDIRTQVNHSYDEMQEKGEKAQRVRIILAAQEQSTYFSRLFLDFFPEYFFEIRTRIETVTKSKVKEYERLREKANAKNAELEAQKKELIHIQSLLSEASTHLKQAKAAFDDYDAEYQRLCTEKQRLLGSIAAGPT